MLQCQKYSRTTPNVQRAKQELGDSKQISISLFFGARRRGNVILQERFSFAFKLPQ
jgi:hypothetical protein